MVAKEIILRETGGVSRVGEFVRVGIPFAKKELTSPDNLVMTNSQGVSQPVQATILNRWHDGSAKWALLDFAAAVPANGQSIYRLGSADEEMPPYAPAIRITAGHEVWRVDTGAATFSVDARTFRPFTSIRSGNLDVLAPGGSACLFSLDGNDGLNPTVDCIVTETEGPLRATLRLYGCFPATSQPGPRYSCRLDFFAGSSQVILEITLHNPRAARHPAGLWDLGGQGSLFFRELSLDFTFPEGLVEEVICSPGDGKPPQRCLTSSGRLAIYQESSGGANWRSPVHRSNEGMVPFTFRGYRILSEGKRVAYGTRATPLVWCGSGTKGVAAVLPRFWQEFPKAIEADRHNLKVSLFPAHFPDFHELQGGEQKTTIVYLDFSSSPAGLEWARSPLTVSAAPDVFRKSGVITDLPGTPDRSSLAERFMIGPEIFLEKREAIDEYGWRNFGEIYADHEAVYHQGPEMFVSHYNNQYDICASFYRRFLATGAPLWGELAADLARHLLDIDLYHTELDREEYNGGMFWHTDHYISAGLATHRSFSREHLRTKDPRFCGGGPGAEHCYTTGLAFHYFLTGNPDYRDAVIGLAEWSVRLLVGPHPVLAVVKRIGRYLDLMRHAKEGDQPLFPRYPLTRGTGNAISACLDAFEVGGERKYLKHAGELIRGAIHPADDIAARNLLDPENAWSYTVLLAAVGKFLEKKKELEEFDEMFSHAQGCLLAYAEWMLLHEYPYLDKPEILEYPNETWSAQDLRKSVIFYHAARYADPGKREAFIDKAQFFFAAARNELGRHPTSSFTRPLALMLQNDWVGSRLEEEIPSVTVPAITKKLPDRPTPRLDKPAVAARIGWELTRALGEISLHREISWLKVRLRH